MISLVGLPGSGKSTVGRQLARRLGVSFWDMDGVIEQRLGCSIRSFFESEGEQAFREVETQVLSSLTSQGTNAVLSTGGGAVLRAENRQLLRAHTHVVYLKSVPDEIYRRLRHDRTRPLLQVEDPLKKLRSLFDERDPLYRETAHFTMETGRPSVATLVNMIVMQLDLAGISAQSGAKSNEC